jgi:hypothetical protein
MLLMALRCADLTGCGTFPSTSGANLPETANVKNVQFLVVEARESQHFVQFRALADGR